MPCLNKVNHTIKYGDSLYKISQMYNTTVENILTQNPYLNPYNLQIGNSISICLESSNNDIYPTNQFPYRTNGEIYELPYDSQNNTSRPQYDTYNTNNIESPQSYNLQNNTNQPQYNSNISTNMQPNISQNGNIDQTQSNINNIETPQPYNLQNNTNQPQYNSNIATDIQPNISQNGNIDQAQSNTNMETNTQSYNSQNQQNGVNCDMSSAECRLITRMNMLLEQHIHWTRMFLISMVEDLSDLSAVNTRLLENPGDIANLYRQYYGDEVGNKINNLLTEHLEIAREIIVAVKNGNDTTDLQKRWHENADTLAEYLSSINPYYNKITLEDMLSNHLDLLLKEITAHIKNEYPQEISIYDVLIEESSKMANYLADGIIKQFPDKFR